MEITTERKEGWMEVRPKGRLDGYWADHLSKTLEEIVRLGDHYIRVNLSELTYISSMGIRVLVLYYKKLTSIEGRFVVGEPSANVKKVLDMVGLTTMLMPASSTTAVVHPIAQSSRKLDHRNATFEVFDLAPAGTAGMRCRAIGDFSLLEGCRFGEADCRTVPFPESSFAVGLGAFGNSFGECSGRFGEFLAVAGAVAYQPSDGSNVPDILLAQGTFVPELQVLYGASCEGAFAHLARFEAKAEARGVALSEIAEAALEMSGAEQVWTVCLAESAGLVGASLRRPPVGSVSSAAPFGHPEIRNWLSFTTERAHGRAQVVTVGVAARSAANGLGGFLRPLSGQAELVGHFHAAAFTYRTLQRGMIDLTKTIRSLFENENLLGILHLIGDDRDIVGLSESEFVRGACWVGPITEIV